MADRPQVSPAAARRSVFSGIESIARRRSALLQLAGGTNPIEIKIEKLLSPTMAVIEGRPTVLFGTNNYLGMTFNPAVQKVAADTVWTSGAGTTASRVASGNLPDHRALEREIAEFLDKRSAIVFSTGFQANLGLVAGLCGPGSIVVMDEDCHASIYDAVVLSGAKKIKFRHNDMGHLRSLLAAGRDHDAPLLIVAETIYSVLGDRAPLAELVALKHEFDAALMLDEAHSMGLFGRGGRGLADEQGMLGEVDILAGTLSKSFGLIGGFAACDHPDFECLRYAARPFMFTAALPPAIVAAARASLHEIHLGDARRERLWRNADALRARVIALGLKTIETRSPVIPLIFDDLAACYRIWLHLLHAGFYGNMLIPPATQGGACIIRLSVCSEHTERDIEGLAAAIAEAAHRHGVTAAMNGYPAQATTSRIGVAVQTRA